MLPLLGATAIAPIEGTPTLSNTGSQVTPPLVVFHTPPLREPTQIVYRCAWSGASGTAMLVTHALDRNGPMLRRGSAFSACASGVSPFCDWRLRVSSLCACAGTAAARTKTLAAASDAKRWRIT